MGQYGQRVWRVGAGSALLLALAGGVLAQTASPSRETVRKEAIQANKAGDIEHHGDAASAATSGKRLAVDKKTAATERTQVRKEAITAQKSGAVTRGESEAMAKSGAKVSSTTSRDKVRKEASQANKAGDIEHHGDTPSSTAGASKRSEPAKP